MYGWQSVSGTKLTPRTVFKLLPLMWIWISNRSAVQGSPREQSYWPESQGLTTWFASDSTNGCKLHKNRYNYITSWRISGSKGRQLQISVHPIYGFVFSTKLVVSSLNLFRSYDVRTLFIGHNPMRLSAWSTLYCSLIADLNIHIKASEAVWLSTGAALYCELMANPYIPINGSNAVWLSIGAALHCGLIADPYIHINGSK